MKNLGLCQKACTGQSVYGHALNREILPLSEFSQLVRFLKKTSLHLVTIVHAHCSRKMVGFHVLWTEILNFFQLPTLIFVHF